MRGVSDGQQHELYLLHRGLVRGIYVPWRSGGVCGFRCGLVEVMNETWLTTVGKYLSVGVAGWAEVEARGGNNLGSISLLVTITLPCVGLSSG